MPLNTATNETATTPGRRTHLYLDTAYPVIKEPPFWYGRELEQIARRGLDGANSQNVRRYAAGAIGLEPIQMQPGKLQEQSDTTNGVIGLSEWNYPSGLLQSRARFRQQPELTGVTYGGSVQSSGDNFLVKVIQAGVSWAQSLTSDITAYGQPTLSNSNVSSDRVAVGLTTDEANRGYVFRFEVPGHKAGHAGHLATKYFGNYCLVVDGLGYAFLHQRVGSDWPIRFNFRYAQRDSVAGRMHQILIKPYNFPGVAGGIEFICSAGDVAAPVGGIVRGYYNTPTLPTVHLYTFDRRPSPSEPPVPSVTIANVPRVDVRRDIRPHFQIARIKYPTSGYVTDGNFFTPFLLSTSQSLVIVWTGVVPSGCSLVGKLYRSDTNAELTSTASTDTSRTYTPVSGVNHYYAKFEFTSDGNDTPMLWGYQVYRNGVIDEPVTTEADASEALREVSVSGAESDPSHETVSLLIEDPKDALTVLNRRGRVSYRLETEFDPNDSSKRSVISEGFLVRTQGRRKSRTTNEGVGGGGSVRAYPAQKWREFMATGVGNWMRLNEKVTWQKFYFFEDASSPGQPWKITDIVYRLINYAGYPADMIDVPDNTMRLWTGNTEQLALTPMQPIGQFCVDLLRQYLGWYLVWDGNAGTRGKWRALAPQVSPYTHRAHFYTSPVHTGRLSHSAGAYGNTNAGYYSESGSVSAFIQGGTLETFVKPPEANAILVIGGGGQELPNKQGNSLYAQWLINRDGLDFFSGYTPDPLNPDWIGELVPLVYVDGGIREQAAADFFCKRLYDLTTHGIKMARFVAPLVLITDASDTSQTQPRPLRYYDPVQVTDAGVTETWLVRNVNPMFSKSAHQMALYELEAPRV